VHHIIFREKDDRVAVGVSGRKMQRSNVFAVEVDSDVTLESDDGKRSLFGGLVVHFHGAAIACYAACGQTLANIILRDHSRTGIGEGGVPAGVIAVIVSIDDEANRLVCDAKIFEPSLDFFGKRSKLVVNDDDSVSADRGRDISSLAFQHVDVSGNFSDLDLDFGPVGSLFLRRGATAAECGG